MTSYPALIGPRLSGPSRWSWLVNTESRHPDLNGVTAREATEVVSLRTFLANDGELTSWRRDFVTHLPHSSSTKV